MSFTFARLSDIIDRQIKQNNETPNININDPTFLVPKYMAVLENEQEPTEGAFIYDVNPDMIDTEIKLWADFYKKSPEEVVTIRKFKILREYHIKLCQ